MGFCYSGRRVSYHIAQSLIRYSSMPIPCSKGALQAWSADRDQGWMEFSFFIQCSGQSWLSRITHHEGMEDFNRDSVEDMTIPEEPYETRTSWSWQRPWQWQMTSNGRAKPIDKFINLSKVRVKPWCIQPEHFHRTLEFDTGKTPSEWRLRITT